MERVTSMRIMWIIPQHMQRKARNTRNKTYTNIVRIRVTIPGTVENKAYKKLQIAVILREEIEDASEAIDRFELKSILEIMREWSLRR